MSTARNPACDQVAIVGLGRSPYARSRPGCTPGSLVAEACVAAATDAGLGPADIDGICGSMVSAQWVQAALGIPEVTWFANPPGRDRQPDRRRGGSRQRWHVRYRPRLPPRLPAAVGLPLGRPGPAATTGDPRRGRRPVVVGDRPQRSRAELDVRGQRLRRLGWQVPARLRLHPGDAGPRRHQLPDQRCRQPQRRLHRPPHDGGVPGGTNGPRPTLGLRHGHPHRRGRRLHRHHHRPSPRPSPATGADPRRHPRPHRLRLGGATARLRPRWSGGGGRPVVGQIDLTLADVDLAYPYEGFSNIALTWFENVGWCGRGEGGAFAAGPLGRGRSSGS